MNRCKRLIVCWQVRQMNKCALDIAVVLASAVRAIFREIESVRIQYTGKWTTNQWRSDKNFGSDELKLDRNAFHNPQQFSLNMFYFIRNGIGQVIQHYDFLLPLPLPPQHLSRTLQITPAQPLFTTHHSLHSHCPKAPKLFQMKTF